MPETFQETEADKLELRRLRDGIDQIDDQLLQLINARAGLAHQIGVIKQGNIYRPEREAQVLRRLSEANPGPLPVGAVQRIAREVMSACLALEQSLQIAYLGPEGTFSETAARLHFGGAPTLIACAGIDDAFRAVEAGNVDYAVVPVPPKEPWAARWTCWSVRRSRFVARSIFRFTKIYCRWALPWPG